VLRRLGHPELIGQTFTTRPVPRRFPVSGLFAGGRTVGTVLLWITLFFSLLLSYFLNSWITAMARVAGFDARTAILGAAALNLGAVLGCLAIGRLTRRYRPAMLIGVCYVVGAVFVSLIGQVRTSGPLLLLTVLLAGFFTIGAQLCTIPLVAGFYRTEERATGIGWSMGVGRSGGILGPAIGGILVAAGLAVPSMFFFGAAMAVCAAIAILCFGWFALRRPVPSVGETSSGFADVAS
jgi:AAHS family 4-hydroxybenzoate transporter-like MFS transporter